MCVVLKEKFPGRLGQGGRRGKSGHTGGHKSVRALSGSSSFVLGPGSGKTIRRKPCQVKKERTGKGARKERGRKKASYESPSSRKGLKMG